ncbi:PREDICTED: telomeric repeat-binding factor 1 [Nanorana parkeri]|uniref:telomeric repeat-binding factor 1 n=1 Tax=Nanorana parkeri TaxID=125878 RepID=UPI000854C25E|nr:PREDICTED: telomeric repeat-binding factor 1 [Nanorana parkeri]
MAEDAAIGEPPFGEVADVATGWVFDYMFALLCRYFTAGDRAEEFQRTCRAMEVLLEAMPALDSEKIKVVAIAQFLTRVQQGKHLDSQFEADETLTPLETAAMVLCQFEEEEENLKNLQEEIKTLVKVQAVAVCMEKGKFKMASEVLDRQFDESEGSKYLRMKLVMVIGKKDPYHEFLENFNYSIMLKKIKSYIGLLLARRPPVFLIQAATKVVEAKAKSKDNTKTEDQEHNRQTCESLEKGDRNSSSECEQMDEQKNSADVQNYQVGADDQMEEELQTSDKTTERSQRRLFSLGVATPWHPDKPVLTSRILQKPVLKKVSTDDQENVLPTKHEKPSSSGASKKKQPWTQNEDKILKRGVQKYGVGNWHKILANSEFNNRTGVMLKDRWRTMKKLDMVDDV